MSKEYKPLVVYPTGGMRPVSKEKKSTPQKLVAVAAGIALVAAFYGSCYIGLMKHEKHLEEYQQDWKAAVDELVEQEERAIEESLEQIRQRGK
ncbi:MAG: hypothetical protein PHS45_04240 [Bacilli bacterium]|nr:hypothetical protein [Bacilli bacterium]